MTSYTQVLSETLALRGLIANPYKLVSTNGGFIVLDTERTALTLSDLSNALEAQHCPFKQTQMLLTYDENNSRYSFAAVVKRG